MATPSLSADFIRRTTSASSAVPDSYIAERTIENPEVLAVAGETLGPVEVERLGAVVGIGGDARRQR